jgi:protein arginine N-methyltransferase 3
VLLLDREVAAQQAFPKGTILKGTLQYAKEKGDDRGITVTVEWEGEDAGGKKAKGSVTRTMA